MKLEDLRKIPTLQTSTIAEAIKADPRTGFYILSCLERFYSGDYGEICEEDTAANNRDLEDGTGHILARYKQAESLTGDIYIEASFYEPMFRNIDYTNIMIMYPHER